MQQVFDVLQQDQRNQAVAERPDAAEGQIGGFGERAIRSTDSLGSTIALDTAENMQTVIEGLRRRVDNGRVPESEREELIEVLDAVESSGFDPAARASTLAALQRLTASYDRMAQRQAEYHAWRAETEAERAEIEAARAEIEAEALQQTAEYKAA